MPRFTRTYAMTDRARALRRTATPFERKLWHALKESNLGVAFRRQHPVGPYVLDFYCAAARLAVELDGEWHLSRVAQDAARTRYLAAHGIHVLRFANRDVIREFEPVVIAIAEAVRERLAKNPPALRAAPLSKGG